ncbi:hypothetical protein A6A04_12320 [Paramagnetospirillum marisnigri]|uniref:Uncharacterized protein n=1 Tax=Paramagnetospirillum marisnigri TaxID=1285242 RepID=A0A178MXH5_9PROT|nr:hypothetical protein A6A04_12320 [Paramagnetospirillum marisnigri]
MTPDHIARTAPPSWHARMEALHVEARRNTLIVRWASTLPRHMARYARACRIADALTGYYRDRWRSDALSSAMPADYAGTDLAWCWAVFRCGGRILTTYKSIDRILQDWTNTNPM